MDEEILRHALERWYKFQGNKKRAKASSFISRAKKYGFPMDVVDTVKAFNEICK